MDKYIRKLKRTHDQLFPEENAPVSFMTQEIVPNHDLINITDSENEEVSPTKDNTSDSEREFCYLWLNYFPWLAYNKSTKMMTCSICVRFCKTGKFIKGCKRYKIDGLRNHASCKKHIESLKLKSESERSLTIYQRAFLSGQKEVLKYFQTIHYIWAENLPMAKYVSMLRFVVI